MIEETIYYTGVGSRSTPRDVTKLMIELGRSLARMGFVLRSGGAPGADQAFELGCDLELGKKEIYRPWPSGVPKDYEVVDLPSEADNIASEFHPGWANYKPTSKMLHKRNVGQVLGKNLQTPSSLLVCWTLDGEWIGGTRTALFVANRWNVPIINLGSSLYEEEDLGLESVLRIVCTLLGRANPSPNQKAQWLSVFEKS